MHCYYDTTGNCTRADCNDVCGPGCPMYGKKMHIKNNHKFNQIKKAFQRYHEYVTQQSDDLTKEDEMIIKIYSFVFSRLSLEDFDIRYSPIFYSDRYVQYAIERRINKENLVTEDLNNVVEFFNV